MKAHELNTTKYKLRRRVGRGISAGQGKTAGRGTKGQNSRTGSSAKPGFAGGQNPLMQAVPKLRGFKPFWDKPTTITTDQIAELKGTVNNDSLYKARLTKSPYLVVRLVAGKNDLKTALKVELQFASTGAIAIVEKAKGSFTQTPKPLRPATKAKKAE
jgi:large subunit ribosomal protein L15